MDFAGGIVVHETAGIAALTIAFFLGKRKDPTKPPHNPGMVMIGAALLWVGWFGFNGGSQLAADGGAALALSVTHISAAAASLSWALWEKLKYGKVSLVGLVTGTIAGLASITPASGFVGFFEAMIIGFLAGILCQEGVNFIRNTLKIDDTLDVFAVHGLGGIFGILMMPLLNSIGFSNNSSWVSQIVSVIIVGLFTLVMSIIIIKFLNLFIEMRISEENETEGLDISVHGERAYDNN
jgi:Amt family ammonium transporter